MNKLGLLCLCFAILACKGHIAALPTQQKTTKLVFNGVSDTAKHIVLISGDEEYRSEEALPQLAKILTTHHGFKCTVLFAQNPAKLGIINPNYVKNIPGLEALDTADMMVIFTRFRALPDAQMQHIDNYFKAGKPVIALRTSTHAFNFGKDSVSNFSNYGNYYNGDKKEWKDGFGRFILGENWVNHHGHHKHQSTRGIIAEGAETHAITNGIESGSIWGPTDVYGVRLPLPDDSQPLFLGQVINRKGEFDENDLFFGMRPTDDELATKNNKGLKVNDVLMPIAWTKSYQIPGGKKGKAFTSTIGASSDLMNESVRRLLVNAIFWTMDAAVPEKANVDLIGEYKPSAYGFKKDEYWENKQLKVSDMKNR